MKVAYFVVMLPLATIAFVAHPTLGSFFNILVVFGFASFWLWEWETKLKARTELLILELTFPTMTESEKGKAIVRISELGARLNLDPYDIAKIFKLVD